MPDELLPPGFLVEPRERPRPLIERLLDGLEAHVQAEAGSIQQYRDFAATVPDPQVALVMGMIVEDEERHHALLRRILASLNDDVMWSHSPEALPEAGAATGAARDAALGVTRTFLSEERHSARVLKELAGSSSDLHGGVVQLLLEWMALDSQKHERALRFMQQRLEQRT
jgi:rubrerythrin